jgi:hypothetical protein
LHPKTSWAGDRSVGDLGVFQNISIAAASPDLSRVLVLVLDVFDRPFLAEVVKLVSELWTAVAVDNNWHAVCGDEERDEVHDLLCRGVFSALADVRETGKLVC